MRGRIWLVLGVAAGVAMGLFHVAYFAGAAAALSNTAQRIVYTGGHGLVDELASGAGRRSVRGATALVALLVPGVTALLLVATARLTLRLRAVVGLLVALVGIAGYYYLAGGLATGALLLALAAAAFAVFATGPLVVAPLAGLAALIGTVFFAGLIRTHHPSMPRSSLVELHRVLFTTPGAPFWLEVVVVAVAAVPFVIAARVVAR